MTMKVFDLNVMAPHEVARVLRLAAWEFECDHANLQSCWQDREAGAVWSDIAKVLERAADRCDRLVEKKLGITPLKVDANGRLPRVEVSE